MYTRHWSSLGLLSAGLPAAQDEPTSIQVAGALKQPPLFGAQGRFPLVVPKDKPGARSVRMLTKLEVVQLRKQQL